MNRTRWFILGSIVIAAIIMAGLVGGGLYLAGYWASPLEKLQTVEMGSKNGMPSTAPALYVSPSALLDGPDATWLNLEASTSPTATAARPIKVSHFKGNDGWWAIADCKVLQTLQEASAKPTGWVEVYAVGRSQTEGECS